MNTAQNFFENGTIIQELLKAFEKGTAKPIRKMDTDTIRIYKFIISAELWQHGKKQPIQTMCISLKEGITNVEPSIPNKIFCEKMEEKDLDFHYFRNYLNSEINTIGFWNMYSKFCRNAGIINEQKSA